MGLAQATLICAGDLFYLGVQCAHPVLFFLTGWVASFVFVNIIYALTAAFGDVGKAIAVVLMVVQVAGSGGTFPPQMLPPVFQTLYRWLPFVHAENAFRAAQFGLWQGDFWWAPRPPRRLPRARPHTGPRAAPAPRARKRVHRGAPSPRRT